MQIDPERRVVRARSMSRSSARGAVVVAAALLFTAGCGANRKAAPDRHSTPETTRVTTTTRVPPAHHTVDTTTTSTTLFPLPVFSPANASPVTAPARRGRKPKRPRRVFAPAVALRWTAKLKVSRLAPGAHSNGLVQATNHDAVAGTVMTPGCPVLVGHPSALCPRPGHTRVIEAGRHVIWWWSWNATSDGTRTGTPLPAGVYSITIGGATVSVTVT